VVTDMKQAANALHWCVTEMEKRYKLMSAMGCAISPASTPRFVMPKAGRTYSEPADVDAGNARAAQDHAFIVVIIDELADLMMVVGKKVEEQIARLAQKARASGIHLVLATQRRAWT
jgi:S-DNA-T family DNA segregation ATPase FtsK/SpoIIIE